MISEASVTAEIVRVSVIDPLAYWTVLSGPALQVVEDVDDYLRHLRFGRSRAESTTKTYAGHLKRLHVWCGERDMSRDAAAFELARYVMRLRTTPRQSSGRGQGELPMDSTLAPALAAIHGFYLHLADIGGVSAGAVEALFTTLPAPNGRAGTLIVPSRLPAEQRVRAPSGGYAR